MGATLFADVSGFTVLTTQLGHQGVEGAEQLTGILNLYYGRLVDLIGDHGGEPVQFFGDALLAFWPSLNSSLADVTLRAACCGLAIQRELDGYLAGDDIDLSLHIAIGAGRAVAAAIGGSEGRWHFVLAGDPVQQIAAAESQAATGEVVLSHQAWTLVESAATGTVRSQGCVRIESVDDPPQREPAAQPEISDEVRVLLRPYVPDAVLVRTDAGLGEWLGELRLVTAMFINLLDFDQSSPDALNTVHVLVEAVQSVLSRYAGVLRNVSVGDKGSVLIAVFGTPPQTHEDDAARCTQVALEIRTALAALGHRSAIGIATGRVFCGPVGSVRGRDYTVIGHAMNLAARLMGQAGDGILVDDATVLAAGDRVVFQSLPEIVVKGLDDPIAVYRPIRVKRPGTHDDWSDLVGRPVEQERLRAVVTALAEHGTGGVVVIEGDAGIGKSSLIAQIRRQAEDRGVPVLQGSGDPIDSGTPYHAWRDVLARLLDLPAFADANLRKMRVAELLGPEVEDMGPLLNAVLPLGLPENEPTRLLEGQSRAEMTRELVVRAIQRSSSGRPQVLLLEDSHWFDDASWELASAVIQRLPEVLVVFGTRPPIDAAETRAAHLSEVLPLHHLVLAELSRTETAELVARRLGVTSIPDEVEQLIFEKAEGHPLFAEELAYTLRDRKLIVIDNGECRLHPDVDLGALELPGTLQGIITSRMDQMTPQQQLTLKVASVVGTTFTLDLLHDIHPVPGERDALQSMLESMVNASLIMPAPAGTDNEWTFRHVLTRDATYELLLFAQRRELHAKVAGWYEGQQDRTPHFGVLAHHWESAGDIAKAVEYLSLESTRIFSDAGLARTAVDVGLDALALLGEVVPRTVPEIVEHLQTELGRALPVLAERGVESLRTSAPLTDPVTAATIATMLGILPSVHQSDQPELFALLSLRALNLTLEAGHFVASPIVYSMYSVVARNLLGDSRGAYEFSRLALDLDRSDGHQVLPPCGFVHYWFHDHWFHPLRTSLDAVDELITASETAGDWQYERFLISMRLVHAANAGDQLDTVIAQGRTYIPRNGNLVRNAAFHLYHEIQYAKALAGETVDRCSLTDDEYDEERDIRWILRSDLSNQIAYYYVYKLRLHYFYREIDEALASAEQAAHFLPGFAGQFVEAEYVLFHALALAARAGELPQEDRGPLLESARTLRERMAAWAADCPENFAHKLALIDVELGVLDGNASPGDFLPVAEEADKAGFVQHAALTYERGALAALRADDPSFARAAFELSSARYRAWGAHAKVADIEQQSAVHAR